MSRLTKQLFVILLLGILVVLVIETWVGLSPSRKLSQLEASAKLSPIYLSTDTLANDPNLKSITRDLAYKRVLKKWAFKDSIFLVVNLRDSLIGLTINGVFIHQTKLTQFDVDPVLEALSNRAYLTFFSNPIKITSDTATIIKEPIVVREAPKDTLEASLNAYKPDTLLQNLAFWNIDLGYGIQVIFSQQEEDRPEIFQTKSTFLNYVTTRKGNELGSYTIQIPMPVGDLRAVYRALPEQGQLVLIY